MSDAVQNLEPPMLVAAPVNNTAILDNCLRRSPDIRSGALPLRIYEGYSSAGAAYNRALAEVPPGAIVIFAHQDVYLPAGFAAALRARLAELDAHDPDWGVAAGLGLDAERRLAGQVWSSNWNTLLRGEVALPGPVVTADEFLFVLKSDGRLRFDEALPGFHLFAADIVQTALAAGRGCYAIELPVIHLDRVTRGLGRDYRRAYRFIARKWAHRLPLHNLVVDIRRWPFAMWLCDRYLRRRARKLGNPDAPMNDPSAVARELGWE